MSIAEKQTLSLMNTMQAVLEETDGYLNRATRFAAQGDDNASLQEQVTCLRDALWHVTCVLEDVAEVIRAATTGIVPEPLPDDATTRFDNARPLRLMKD